MFREFVLGILILEDFMLGILNLPNPERTKN